MEWRPTLPGTMLMTMEVVVMMMMLATIGMTTAQFSPSTTEATPIGVTSSVPKIAGRLVNGSRTSTYMTGRLELSIRGGEWKDICAYHIKGSLSDIFCKGEGFLHGRAVFNTPYGNASDMHWIRLSCQRELLTQCTIYQPYTNQPYYCPPMSIVCFNNTEDVLDFKLADGEISNVTAAGRLEVSFADLGWGAVCSYSSTLVNNLACQYMGYKHGQTIEVPAPENGTMSFTISSFYCSYGAKNITDCEGHIGSFYNCYKYLGLRCSTASVRLRTNNPDVFNVGSVEVFDDNKRWAEVCDGEWDDNDAKVVCRDLGYKDGKALCCNKLGLSDTGTLSRGGVYTNITCTGNEESLLKCTTHRGNRLTCPYVDGRRSLASVICYDQPKEAVDMKFNTRLVHNGKVNSAQGWGIVQVKRFGFWGEVCPDDFTDAEASVACRGLPYNYVGGKAFGGYGFDSRHYHFDDRWQRIAYVYSTAPVWITNVTCQGNETSLDQCELGDWGIPKMNCRTGSGVICYRKEMRLQLANSGGKTFGRLEIVHDGLRGTICGDRFDERDANAACRELNFTKGHLLAEEVPRGKGPVFMSNVRCDSDNQNLFTCFSQWKNATPECMSHDNDAKVSCFNDVGLTYGNHQTGVVVTYDERSNPKKICDRGYFDDNAAAVVCKSLGFKKGLALPPYVFGRVYYSIDRSLVGLQCAGSEESLTSCPTNETASCSDYSASSDYATVSCYDEEETRAKYTLDLIPDEGSQLAGRVRVFYKQASGYVCQQHVLSSYWNDSAADVICRDQGHMGGVAYNFRGYIRGPYFITDARNCSSKDKTLETCAVLGNNYCSSQRAAGVLCYDTAHPKMALTSEGPNPHLGRIQITIDNEEGRVCGISWYDSSARGVCKMLGYNDGKALRFPKSDKPVFMTGVRCYSSPATIFFCENSGWRREVSSNCSDSNATEAGVLCFKNSKIVSYDSSVTKSISGEVKVLYTSTRWYSVCAELGLNNAKVICRELGFNMAMEQNKKYSYSYYTSKIRLRCNGNENSTSECRKSTTRSCRYAAKLFCYNANPDEEWTWTIKKGYHGTVEVLHQGMTGYICGDGWNNNAANTLCRQQGYKGGVALGASSRLYQTVVWFSNVTCPETATNMTQCQWNKTVDITCRRSSSYPAAVLCYSKSAPSISLVGGVTSGEGRVEIDYDGVKGSICNRRWSLYDARVLCKQLGYEDGSTMSVPENATHSGAVHMSGLDCRTQHTSIFECPSYGWGVGSNDPTCLLGRRDAWVSCYLSVRILGRRKTMGPVSYYNGYLYELVCSNGFDDHAAKVVCTQLGFQKGLALYPRAFGYQRGMVGPTVDCSGSTVEVFDDCVNKSSPSCRNTSNYASVACSNQDDVTGYKVSPQWGNHGIAIINHFDNPGYICVENFDDRDAQTICREAFYLTGVAYTALPDSTTGNFFWLSNLNCTGSENRLDECRIGNKMFQGQFGKVEPSPGCYPAGVFCGNTYEQVQFEWRLRNGNSSAAKPTAGLVEVKMNGTWGSVCTSWYFQHSVADILCRQLGYTAGDIITNSFGKGLNAVWVNRIQCDGNETRLQDCKMDIASNRTCYNKLAVRCDQSVRLNGFHRLPPGETLRYGRLEVVHSSGSFASVCASGFNNDTAKLACKALGHTSAIYQDFKGKSNFSNIFTFGSANITCRNGAKSFTDCTVHASDAKTCPNDLYVVLFCLDTATLPEEGLKLTMQHKYAGEPRALRYGFEGSICGSGFSAENAGMICRQQGSAYGYNLKPTRRAPFSVLPYVLSGLNCSGTETDVSSCLRTNFITSNTDCQEASTPNILCSQEEITFRRNPPDATWGRAEVKVNGRWRAIDYRGFETEEASVFCKSLNDGYDVGDFSRWSPLSLPSIPIGVSKVSCMGHENSILECQGNWTSAANDKKNSSSAVYVNCLRGVRLSYGTERSGMVLYSKKDSWGAICADKFDHKDARVVCRQLGFDDGFSLCCSPFGSTWRDYHYTDVECNGNETRLEQCKFSTDKDALDSCSSRNYASVACYNYGDSKDYNMTFKGGSTYTGAVQINYLGSPGLICSDGWDDSDAHVACREMGFESGLAYSHYKSSLSYYTSNGGPYWSSGFKCSGTENYLSDCQHVPFGNVTECKARHFAGALCYHDKAIVYRMVTSTKSNNSVSGRVEAYVNGNWSSLCGSYWGDNDAKVFCRSQGYVDGVNIDVPDGVPAATGPVVNVKMRCNGTERELNDCVHEGWKEDHSSYCSNPDNVAAVNCFLNVRLDSWFGEPMTHGAFRLYTGDSWNLVCDNNFDDVTAQYVCNELGYADGRALCCSAYTGVFMTASLNDTVMLHCKGDEASLTECISAEPCDSGFYASVVCQPHGKPFNDTAFNIKNSEEGPSGRLEVEHLGITGRICSQNWDDTDAQVFCKAHGFTSGLAYYHSHEYEFNEATDIGPFFLSNFDCIGNETSLMDCPHTGQMNLGNCTHSASVACYSESGVKYRLAGGKSNYGRVELAFDNKWGTVCDDDWDDLDAEVFCRSMNYTTGIAQKRAQYGQGTGPIWLQDIQCTGSEPAIHACPHTGFTEEPDEGWWFYTPRCSTHKYDATVFCYANVRVVNDYQLLDSGALQVYHNNQWMSVCDSSMTNKEAAVACRSLMGGFVDGVVIKGSAFAPISAPLNISSIKCNGDEKMLDKCNIELGQCPSGHYASVQCSNTTIEQTGYKIRLANDTYSSDRFGIVEIYDNGVWKRICHQGWDDNDATVVCKELNFKGGVMYTHINKHFGPIGFRQFTCTGSETSLRQCGNTTDPDLEDCQYDDFDAGVLCYNGSGIRYSMSGGSSPSSGRVDITYDGKTAGVCSAHFSHNDSKVFCRSMNYADGVPYEPEDPSPAYPYYYLNGVFCQGDEKTLLSCLNTGFNSSYLSFYCNAEAYTHCYKQNISITKIRLMLENGTLGTDRGRVEVFLSGPDEWGTVCDDLWDNFDATVVCRSLNFQWGEGLGEAAHGRGTGRIWLDNVECLGNETSLDQCRHKGYSDHNCYHSEDAAVICSNKTRPTLPPTTPTTTTPTTTTTPSTPTATTTPTTTTTPATATTPTVTSATSPTSGTTQTATAEAAHTKDKTVPIAVGVCVSIFIIIIIVIILVVLIRRNKICVRRSVPHQRFSDETIGVSPDGSVSMHNQMFDAADPGSDPLSDASKYLAGDGEITLDHNRVVYSNNGHSNGHSGNLDSGFANPLYSVMQPTSPDAAGFSQEPLKVADKGDEAGDASKV